MTAEGPQQDPLKDNSQCMVLGAEPPLVGLKAVIFSGISLVSHYVLWDRGRVRDDVVGN